MIITYYHDGSIRGAIQPERINELFIENERSSDKYQIYCDVDDRQIYLSKQFSDEDDCNQFLLSLAEEIRTMLSERK